MEDKDTQGVLPFARIGGKKVEADFEGGTLTSDGGCLLLRMAEQAVGIVRRLAGVVRDRRHPSYVDHDLETLMRQRVFQIALGYEDANDANTLRTDPALKASCERLPLTGTDLASQPTLSRFENACSRTDVMRMAYALGDIFVASFPEPPQQIVLDIDDTQDVVHGGQQLALFNAYHREYSFQPLHIYDGLTGRLITAVLRPGRTPSGEEIVAILKRVVTHLRRAWPQVQILLRGDGHFSCPEVHAYCQAHQVWFVLGQGTNTKLKELAEPTLQQARDLWEAKGEKVRLFTEFDYQAGTWEEPLRVVAKAEISAQGENLRFVTTNLVSSRPSFIYDQVYAMRGRMENFIKNHKTHLASDRTSCHSFEANQMRLLLHSAAYMLLHAFQQLCLHVTQWEQAYFDTLQNRLLKVAARVVEWRTVVRFHFPTPFPLKEVYQLIHARLQAALP